MDYVPNIHSSQLSELTDVQGRALTSEDFIKVHTEPLYVRTREEYQIADEPDGQTYHIEEQ